jgi:hypothetical protein
MNHESYQVPQFAVVARAEDSCSSFAAVVALKCSPIDFAYMLGGVTSFGAFVPRLGAGSFKYRGWGMNVVSFVFHCCVLVAFFYFL